MKALDLSIKLKIIEKRLEGESFEEIANELNIAKSTAFSVYAEFENGKAFYLENPEAYLFTDQFKEIAKTIKEKKLNPSEFLEVYGIWSMFHYLDLSVEKSMKFLKLLEDSREPEAIVSTLLYLQEYAEKNGKTITLIIDNIIKNLDKTEKLNKDLNKLRQQNENAKRYLFSLVRKESELQKKIKKYGDELKIIKNIKKIYKSDYKAATDFLIILKKEDIGKSELKDIIVLSKYLIRYGILPQDLPKILTTLQFLEGAGLTPDSLEYLSKGLFNKDASQILLDIYNYIKNRNDLESYIEDKRNEMAKINEEIQRLKEKKFELEKDIEENEKREENLKNEIEALELEIKNKKEEIQSLNEKINTGYNLINFVLQESGELPQNIKTFIELDNEIKKMREEKERLKNEIDALKIIYDTLIYQIKDIKNEKEKNTGINEPKFILNPIRKNMDKNIIIGKKIDEKTKKTIFLIRMPILSNNEKLMKKN